MRARFHLLICLLVPGLSRPAGLDLAGGRATFTTEAMIAVVEDGSIVRLFNRLTGSEYVVPVKGAGPAEIATGLVYTEAAVAEESEGPGVVGPTPTSKGAKVLKPVLVGLKDLSKTSARQDSKDSVTYEFAPADGQGSLAITYSLDPRSGDLLVRQKATGKRKGLSALRFALPPVVCHGSLLLPALGGIKGAYAESKYQFELFHWKWPTGWQLPLIVFQHPGGGLWVHTQDAEKRHKGVQYRDVDKQAWVVSFDTENEAPFEPHTSAESVTWRINVYSGDWTIPLDRYKQWAYGAFRMPEKERFRPPWVDDIRVVIKHADYLDPAQFTAYLNLLKEHTDPARTLLFMTHWGDFSEGWIVPRWVASERGVQFNREARGLGFRTMYFANYIGITPNHPRFHEFKRYVIRNPYTGELEGWNLKGEWSVETQIKLYYVSPAAKAWREYQIGQFKALLEAHPADGLFIDQSFLMFNDGNGRVDGMTTVDGNLAYHEQLARAIPGVAIGGEGVNEISMQYESFWEHHPLSLHIATDTQGRSLGWKLEPAAFDRMVPLVPRYMLPHTRLIGYLGFPETGSPSYAAWRDALRVYEGIPTVTKPTLGELRDPSSEVRRVLRQAMHGVSR